MNSYNMNLKKETLLYLNYEILIKLKNVFHFVVVQIIINKTLTTHAKMYGTSVWYPYRTHSLVIQNKTIIFKLRKEKSKNIYLQIVPITCLS